MTNEQFMIDIQVKSTDICKQVFLSILPSYVESARKNILEGYVTVDEGFAGCGSAALNAAIKIARQWLEY